MILEWNPEKAERNRRRHRITFEEAATVFLDRLATTYRDPDHSHGEDREITIGYSTSGRLLFVSHVERNGRTRIISARNATRTERKLHEEGDGHQGER